MIGSYFSLIKPRIILGNLITAAGSFSWASKGHFETAPFFSLLIGLSCVIASAATFNNWIDREIDAKMERTKKRPLVTGAITPKAALIFAACLGSLGLVILAFLTNFLATSLAFFGLLVYVVLYTPLKHRTPHATLVGSIAGAVPPLVGYAVASGLLNLEAFALFLLLVVWQMPHFYALALYRCEEYRSASIPTLAVLKGSNTTKLHIFSYVVLFGGVSLFPALFGKMGASYWIVALTVSSIWLWLSLRGFMTQDDLKWGRSMFRFSLVVIIALTLALTIGGQ